MVNFIKLNVFFFFFFFNILHYLAFLNVKQSSAKNQLLSITILKEHIYLFIFKIKNIKGNYL